MAAKLTKPNPGAAQQLRDDSGGSSVDGMPVRRPSLGGFLRRTKSGELGKKAQALREAELERQRSMIPPQLPDFTNNTEQLTKSLTTSLHISEPIYQYNEHYQMASANVDHPLTRSYTSASAFSQATAPKIDPFANSQSMAHRSRYSYASSAISSLNSPRRVRRRKDPIPFNILVVGAASCGKSAFVEFLKTAMALPPRKRPRKIEEDEFHIPAPASGNFVPHFVETEVDNERIGLTIWDSEGFEKSMADLNIRELALFIENKFEETFAEETKVARSPGVQDTHIHAVFLILDPARLDRNLERSRKAGSQGRFNGFHLPMKNTSNGALDEEMDLQLLRSLYKTTTVIPVISKADTITAKHMKVLKRSVWDTIKAANLDPLESLGGLEDEAGSGSGSERIDEEASTASSEALGDSGTLPGSILPQARVTPPMSPNAKRLSSQSFLKHKASQDAEENVPFLPLSIISPDPYEPNVIGRQFAWGFADPYNEEHCDFQRLKEAVFSEWRGELREASREQWYEGWRTNKLKRRNRNYAQFS